MECGACVTLTCRHLSEPPFLCLRLEDCEASARAHEGAARGDSIVNVTVSGLPAELRDAAITRLALEPLVPLPPPRCVPQIPRQPSI